MESLEVNALQAEFPHRRRVSILVTMRQALMNYRHQQQRRSTSGGIWHTGSSTSPTSGGSPEEVYNREIIFDEEAAKAAFQRLMKETPMVYGWNMANGAEGTPYSHELDQVAYAEFKNTFVAPSLKHRPSILTDFEEQNTTA